MKTFTTRAVAVSGAIAITLGAGGCTNAEPPSTRAPGATAGQTDGLTTSGGTASAESDSSSQAAGILAKAKKRVSEAKSGAFMGQIRQSGRTIKVEYKGTSDGKTADVTIETQGEGKARFLSVGGETYVQADVTFWQRQGASTEIQQKATGKFIKAPASSATAAQGLSLENFLQSRFASLTSDQLTPEPASDALNGKPCWVLIDKKGRSAGSIYISKDTFDVLRVTGTTASPGQLDFAGWDQEFDIKAPAASDIVKVG